MSSAHRLLFQAVYAVLRHHGQGKVRINFSTRDHRSSLARGPKRRSSPSRRLHRSRRLSVSPFVNLNRAMRWNRYAPTPFSPTTRPTKREIVGGQFTNSSVASMGIRGGLSFGNCLTRVVHPRKRRKTYVNNSSLPGTGR